MKSKVLLAGMIVALLVAGCGKTAPTNTTQQSREKCKDRKELPGFESKQFVNRTFGGSLPQFITAFMNDKKLIKQEAEDLKKLIDSYKEEE